MASYQAYRQSPDAWALGRFVIPVSRLAELEQLLTSQPRDGPSLPLAALLGPDVGTDLLLIEAFNRKFSQRGARVESLEVKADSEAEVLTILSAIPASWTRYVEVPLCTGRSALLNAIASHRAFAKARTGGTALGAFPTTDELLGFLVQASRRGLAFKATAGLHHPLRGTYPLTYEAGAPRGVMYGFLNLLLASAVVHVGASVGEAGAALLENQPASIRFVDGELHWRKRVITVAALASLRHGFFHSFGSCSFREPLDELIAGGW